MLQREPSVCQQTGALLYKNLLLKWRKKTQTLQESLLSITLLLLWLMILTANEIQEEVPDMPSLVLGRVDEFNATGRVLGYTPRTKSTKQIMEKVASELNGTGIKIKDFENEEAMKEAWEDDRKLLGVVFKDSFTYEIRISRYLAPEPNDNFGRLAVCEYEVDLCSSAQYWYEGFIFLQTSIDSAIIEIMTNHSVWEEMKSTVAVLMEFKEAILIRKFSHALLIVMYSMAFSPLLYFLSFIVAREKRKHKYLMTIMGLQDSAFWLSWGLLYAGFIFIIANLLTLMNTYIVLRDSCYSVQCLLFFLYGLSSMCFCFMLTSLLRKPKLTSIVGFLLTLSLTGLSLIILVDHLPSPVAWVFGMLFSPCAFSIGLSQVIFLENEYDGANLSLLLEGPHPLLAVFFILSLNGIIYMLLAIYFDKVLPNTYGMRHSPLFFFKSSYWLKSKQRASDEEFDNEESCGANVSDFIESVPSEMHGKEAIRIKNVKKTYEEDRKVEALRGLLFDVYEGQITALLGHSGAGKTTLLNILSGISPPTDGAVSIYKQLLSDMHGAVQLEKNIGFCPQFNINFDILTVKENVRLFAKVKGIPSKKVEQEVQKVLSVLDIIKIQDLRAADLSGGQSRKLTLGIAILGDPQILLLDEPTAGLDPSSRHHVWTLLKERKANRVTLFSTQFMDEADILADRKAVLSKGRLKCVGTSMFLKRKWGIGYHLRMHVHETCDAEQMTSVVKNHIPNTKLSRQHEQELIYILPFENMESFPELFYDLDKRIGQEIANYGVSMTTLEDVFLKLEGEEAIDQADYGVFSQETVEEERDGDPDDEMEQTLLSLSETGNATVSGSALWRQQVVAIAKVRFLKLKHESKTFRSILLLFFIILIPLVLQIATILLEDKFLARELTPDIYLLRPGEQPYKHYKNLLVQNDTGSNIDSLILSIRDQNINLDVTDGNNTEDLSYNTALRVSHDGQHSRFTLLTSIRAINGFPVLLNIISNAFLRTYNSTERLRVWNNPFTREPRDFTWMNIFIISSGLFGIFSAGFPPHLAMSSIHDGKIKALSQLRLSGLFPSAYWCGQAMVDVTIFWALLVIMTSILLSSNHNITLSPLSFIALILCLTGYAASSVVFIYVISFVCRKGRNNPDFWSCILIMVGIIASMAVSAAGFFTPQVSHIAVTVLFNLLIPVYPLPSYFSHLQERDDSDEPGNNLDMQITAITPIIAPYLHCILFMFLLRCLEMRYGKKTLRGDPLFRISPKNDKVCSNPDEPEGEEDSVQDERTRVGETMAIQRPEEDSAIVASSLRKEYKDKKASSIFRKKKKVATRNVSFCVKKGEILGLLGPNGAGKTTTIRMLTGDTKPTAGQVLITGVESTSGGPQERENESTGILGYCPQENPLWPSLTVKEHLEVYAAVKGMRKEDAAVAIKRVTDALELNEHLKTAARKLSEGVKRKLCFALSMLGNPTVVLLDEPSTGMDPKGQQRMWRAIRAAFKNKERGAILTTHYMEEAEAICDRVAIMVSGKLRCIGSIQQLKSKFGKGYFLEIKVRDLQQVDVLHKEILKIFPHAARQERFSSLLSYKIPMDNVHSLSQAFSMLEEVKRAFTLEEYSFSQSTLEQVFIELTKEQEKDNVDPALGSNFEWKKLHEEDT